MADPPQIQLDPIKYLNSIPQFSGNINELSTFTRLIDRIHPVLLAYHGLSQSVFSDIIKSRITGRAREILEINTQAQSWNQIKELLNNNFGERKSCEELFDDLRSVTFETNTIDCYNNIKYRLRRLNNKSVLILGEGEAANQVAINNQRSALNIFKSKIPEPMKTVLACRNPQSLESAINILYENGYDKIGKDGQIYPRKTKMVRENQKFGNNPQSRGNRPQRSQNGNFNRNDFPRRNQIDDYQNLHRQNQHDERQRLYRPFQQGQRWQSNQQHQKGEPMEVNTAQNFQPAASTGNYPI